MSALHEQAMNFVYQQVMERLLSYLTRSDRAALQLLIQRLIVSAGGIERIGHYRVLVAFNGGKDSAYTLALLRAAQLSIAVRSSATFTLRVANMRHAGMTSAVMQNINRCYSALFLHDDPRVELVVVDHRQVRAFDVHLPYSAAGREQSRSDILLGGHLTAGDPRTTFCNSCYLTTAEFLGHAAYWKKGVHAVVSGDSLKRQKQYATWIMRLVRHEGQPVEQWHVLSFNAAMEAIDRVGQAYHRELYQDVPQPASAGPHPVETARQTRPKSPGFLPVADLLGSSLEEHWTLLTDFLDFRFDDLSFSFSESDCANPLLMAHMRGLKAEFVYDRDYAAGVAEYLSLAATLMRRKGMPLRLIQQTLAAYEGDEGFQQRRELASRYAVEYLGLNETQLVCLLFAPFVDHGARLESFLRRCHPGMLIGQADIHRALSRHGGPDQVVQWLKDVSGLSLTALQALYEKQRVDFADNSSMIARVRATDPDTVRVMTIDPLTGSAVAKLISGH